MELYKNKGCTCWLSNHNQKDKRPSEVPERIVSQTHHHASIPSHHVSVASHDSTSRLFKNVHGDVLPAPENSSSRFVPLRPPSYKFYGTRYIMRCASGRLPRLTTTTTPSERQSIVSSNFGEISPSSAYTYLDVPRSLRVHIRCRMCFLSLIG
jgi:hypothetical protein